MKIIKKIQITASIILCSAFSFTAFAINGVLEINQTCATALGCFSGDTPGYPVNIDGNAGRSYRLTSDLIVPNVNLHGIVVAASDISIDLNGFSIVGLACVGNTIDCTPAVGLGNGIDVPSSNSNGVSVVNGNIIGMGQYGVRLRGDQSEAKGLKVRWNRLDGIFVGRGSKITDSIAYENGDDGISTSFGSTITGNVAYNNGGRGIIAGRGSTVRGNAVNDNDGIGILALSGCTVQNNTAVSNTGFGLSLNAGDAYQGNVIRNNAGGTVTGGFNMGGNFCNTNAVCP